MKRVRKSVAVRQAVVAGGVEAVAAAVGGVEAAEAGAMVVVVVAVDVSQTRIIAKPRGNRASRAGRSRNRL
jgi:hypothetical protein